MKTIIILLFPIMLFSQDSTIHDNRYSIRQTEGIADENWLNPVPKDSLIFKQGTTMFEYDQIINDASSLHAELISFRNTIDSLNSRIQYLETKIPLVAQGGTLRPYDVFSKVPNSVNAKDARKWRHEGDSRIRRAKIIRIDEETGEVIGIVYTGYNQNGYWESKVSEGYIMGQWSSFYYEGKQYQDIKNPFK